VGRIIVIEGIDGSGKSTICHALYRYACEHLEGKHYLFRDPGSTELSELIRGILKSSVPVKSKKTRLLLHAAAHSEIVAYIRELQDNPETGLVVAARWWHSTYVYQGLVPGLKLDVHAILTMRETLGLNSSQCFFLDVPELVLLERLSKREEKDEYDRASIQDLRLRKEKYFELIPRYLTSIEGELTVPEIVSKIRSIAGI